MGENLTRKILADHLDDGELKPGEPIALRVDQTLLQDATGTMACMQFEQLGVPRVRWRAPVQYVDHNVVAARHKNPDDHRFLRALARRYGLHFSRPGNGISHYVHLERFGRPGDVLIGADSHTTTGGALGMVAIGAGGLDVAVVHGRQPVRDRLPGGRRGPPGGRAGAALGAGQGRDPRAAAAPHVRGGKDKVFEFTGPGMATCRCPSAARSPT